MTKPAGYLVHPADKPQPSDQVLLKDLRNHLGQRVDAIHRIDRPTCGIVLFSLDREMTRQMNVLMDQRKVEKNYLAVISGRPEEEQWSNCEPLRKTESSPLQAAQTDFRILQTSTNPSWGDISLSLLECRPQTGRFHQIRRHLAAQGHPIVGDYRYAGIALSDKLGQVLSTGTRMLLQAKSLSFQHPATGELLDLISPTEPLIAGLFESA